MSQAGVETLRRAAIVRGRRLADDALDWFEREYGTPALSPALVVRELLTDYFDARLVDAPLGLDVLADTRWDGDRALIRLNTRIRDMEGVKDARGVGNVALWHEVIHVRHDAEYLRGGGRTPPLPGFDAPAALVCYRGHRQRRESADEWRREFTAEEAGRAAAVHPHALRECDAFREFLTLRAGPDGVAGGWSCLYATADAIGVNISALTTQLGYDGVIAIERQGGRPLLIRQDGLLEGLGGR